MKPGSIIIFNWKRGGFFSTAQRIFTHYWIPGKSPKHYAKSYVTHTAIVSHDIEGIPSYFGAEMATAHQPLDVFLLDSEVEYIVFEPTGFIEKEISLVLQRTYKEYAARTYAFTQIPWFVWRWLIETFTRIDMRNGRNPFIKNAICSEVVWKALAYYGETANGKGIQAIIDLWRTDSTHAGDIFVVLKMLPKQFTVTEKRWTTPLPPELAV